MRCRPRRDGRRKLHLAVQDSNDMTAASAAGQFTEEATIEHSSFVDEILESGGSRHGLFLWYLL